MSEEVVIRRMLEADTERVVEMMKVFYASDAVITKSPEEILRKDIHDAVSDHPYLDGFVFEVDGKIVGYSMTAPGYTTEFGGTCMWVEDLYIEEGYRDRHIASKFFDYIHKIYPDAVRFRLEAELENERAIHVYEREGYHKVEYLELSKEFK